MKRRIAALAIGAAAAPALALSAAGAAHAAVAPDSSSTCPTYYGCIHSNSSSGSSVTWKNKYYGTHAIYGWNGTHYVQNSQTEGAYMSGLDVNGHVRWTLDAGTGAKVNMGPVYYIRLTAGPPCWPNCR